MIIGIDASRALLSYKTGIHWYVACLIQYLQQLPTRHRFVWYVDRSWTGSVAPNERTDIRVLRWPLKRGWTQGRLSYEMLRRSPDVLIIPASAVPIIHPKKTISVIHDIGYLQFPNYLPRFAYNYLAASTRYALHASWKIITVSQWTRMELIRTFSINNPDRIIVAPIGIDSTYYCPPDSSTNEYDIGILKKYGITTPYIITLGRIDARKNLITLARAWGPFASLYGDYHLVHVGPNGHGGQVIINEITKVPHADRIHFLGWVIEDEKRALLRNAAAFAFPSLYEGFGIPLLEAQACGIPCVIADSSSLGEVSGGAALCVNPLDKDEWFNALSRIISDDVLRLHLYNAGRANAGRYGWENCANIIFDAVVS